MQSSLVFHRMPSSCARGATASGGVTFVPAASLMIPTEHLLCSGIDLGSCKPPDINKMCSAQVDPDKLLDGLCVVTAREE